MKKILSLFLLASLSIFCLAATIPETFVFLDYYDSLTGYVGKPGHYFVRDAGNTKTGQHGDPTVLNGWAIYVWNNRLTSSKAGWSKIADQQTLDSSIGGSLATNYVTKAAFNAAMESVAATYVSNSVFTTTVSDFTTKLNNALSRIGVNESNISSLSGQINALNNSKQTNLVSGINIKSINSQSLLDSGNINLATPSDITAEHIAMTNAITTEVNVRSTADIALSNRVDNLEITKQTNLVSGVNIKTINNQSILGEGNITLATVSDIASEHTSMTNAVAVETSARIAADSNKQDILVSGTNIKTINNGSILGSGNISIATPDDVTTEHTAMTNTIALEATIRSSADTVLNTRIDSLLTMYNIDISSQYTTTNVILNVYDKVINYVTSTMSIYRGSIFNLNITNKVTNSDTRCVVYIDDNFKLRPGLPITINVNGYSKIFCIGNTKNVIYSLPAKIVIESHSSDYAILTIESMPNDSYSPVIDSSNINYRESDNSFVCPSSDAALTGSYLLQPIQLLVKYPVEGGVQTNEFTEVGDCYYNKAYYSGKVTPDKQVLFTDDKSWFTLIYYTENGCAEFTKEITK